MVKAKGGAMKIEDFGKVFALLTSAYRKEVASNEIEAYFVFLGDTDFEDLLRAVENIVMKEEFFPIYRQDKKRT